MSSQIACTNRSIVALITFVQLLPQSESLNVSSNRLLRQMQSRIGCICLTFPPSAFSNVASNPVPEHMHSCIGCICFTFPQSAFSNVSSNCLNNLMKTYIAYTSLRFLCWYAPYNSLKLQKKEMGSYCSQILN